MRGKKVDDLFSCDGVGSSEDIEADDLIVMSEGNYIAGGDGKGWRAFCLFGDSVGSI